MSAVMSIEKEGNDGHVVTMQDVADHAGVSKTTVSRVLNNDPTVSEELRLRIQASMETLEYQPNRAARRLRKQLNDVIGFVIPDVQNPFFAAVLRGAEDLAYEHGIGILPYSTVEDIDRQQAYIEMLQAEQIAGMVIVPATETKRELLVRLQRARMPFVLLDRWLDDFDADTVRVDNFRGAYDAVKHLINLGYNRIGIVAGLNDLSTEHERLRGYYSALSDAHITLDESLVKRIDETLIKQGNFETENGYRLTRELLLSDNPPEAVFVTNTLKMYGTLRAANELNVQIPQQLATIAFDELPWSGELCPPLTTVAQPTYDLGRESMLLLLRRMREPQASFRTMILQTQLVIRESCGARLRQNKAS